MRDLAAVGPQQRRQHLDSRGLAGAVRAEESEDLAGGDVEGHAVDGLHLAEFLDQVVDANHGDFEMDGSDVNYSRKIADRVRQPLFKSIAGDQETRRSGDSLFKNKKIRDLLTS